MNFHHNLNDFLQFCSENPLSGSFLQKRSEQYQNTPTMAFKAAAVLVGFAPDLSGNWQILLTRRSDNLRNHRGQIAFAGGKCDPNDENAIATALRETHEETGIAPHNWQVSGSLPTCFTPSGFAISPILAHAQTLPETHANADEVAEIFWLPADFAFNPHNYVLRDNLPTLPYLHYDIWGATAIILHYLSSCWRDKFATKNSALSNKDTLLDT